ncbi:MAG: hypothetical protein IT376_07170 [Polyangiaceae bacterium]|nr:hypothetical protein [Polyangiaceae bacterium]
MVRARFALALVGPRLVLWGGEAVGLNSGEVGDALGFDRLSGAWSYHYQLPART